MSSSQRLTRADVRGAHRLVSDLRELRHDPAAMRAELVDALVRLVGGTCAFACDVADWRPGGAVRFKTLTPDSRAGGAVAALVAGLAASDNLWGDPSFVEGVKRTDLVVAIPFHELTRGAELGTTYPLVAAIIRDVGHVDHLLAWHRVGPGRRDITGVSIHRWGRGERRFGRRETDVARVVFEELHWLAATGRLDEPVPGAAGLPPRLNEVLGLLRQGHAPKQVAARLGLSVHTVRDHVKRLHARLGVRDRNELMAVLDGRGRAGWRGTPDLVEK